jgi:hypothetical protein
MMDVQDAGPISAEERNERERRFLLQEFLETERTYMRGLENLKEFYITPLKSNPIKYGVTNEFVSKSFSEVNIIQGINQLFLQQVEIVLQANSVGEKEVIPGEAEGKLSDVIIRQSQAFKLYIPFINQYKTIMENIKKEYSKNSSFKKFIDGQTSSLAKKDSRINSLSSLLITPIQRLTRYRLLMENVVKCFDKDSNEVIYKKVLKAAQCMKDVASYCNTKESELENDRRLIELSRQFNRADLVQPGRKYVNEANDVLYQQANGRYGSCSLYMFNDLMYIQKKSVLKQARKIPIEPDVYAEMEDEIVMKIMKRDTESASPKKRKSIFRPAKNHLLKIKYKSSEECRSWVDCVNNAVQSVQTNDDMQI